MIWRVLLWLFLPAVLSAGCDAAEPARDSSDVTQPVHSWKLPKQLREISGLAAAPSDLSGRVYAVADERAHVFQLDPVSGQTVSVFGLGKPAVKGDFEGVAMHAKWLYLITSDGTLLRTLLADDSGSVSSTSHDGATLDYETFSLDTGCQEVEGLATAPDKPWLWLICKEIKPGKVGDSGSADAGSRDAVIRLEAWSAETKALLPAATLELPLAGVLALTGQKKFKPSGLAFVPAEFVNGGAGQAPDLLVISGAQRAYSRFRWSGNVGQGDEPQLLGAGRLHSRHRQPEGVEVGAGGTLLIADEGAGKRGKLRVYPQGSLP